VNERDAPALSPAVAIDLELDADPAVARAQPQLGLGALGARALHARLATVAVAGRGGRCPAEQRDDRGSRAQHRTPKLIVHAIARRGPCRNGTLVAFEAPSRPCSAAAARDAMALGPQRGLRAVGHVELAGRSV